MEADLDFGLIHADMLRENIMVSPRACTSSTSTTAALAMAVRSGHDAYQDRDEDDYDLLRASLLAGYGEVRQIDLSVLDFFILLRALTYVGWVIHRMGEPGSDIRNQRFRGHRARTFA